MKTHLYGLSVVNYFPTGLQFQSDRQGDREKEREGERHANVFCVLNSQFSAYCAEPALSRLWGVEWCGDGVPADCLIDIIKYLAIFRISFRFCYWQIWHAFCPKLAFGQGCNGQCSCRHQLTIFLASFSVYELGPKPQSHSHTQTHTHMPQQVSLALLSLSHPPKFSKILAFISPILH